MKYIELLVCGKDSKYVLHVPDDIATSTLTDVLKTHFDCRGEVLLYHVPSGRFLSQQASFSENAVESGDTVLLYF